MQLTEVAPKYYTLDPSHEVALNLASHLKWYSPKFSPKNVPRFYDISSLTENCGLFQQVIDVMALRYRAMGADGPTHILGFDARGFLLGTPIALALNLPFVLLRKAEKSPGVLLKSFPYSKEYKEDHPDTMAVRQGSVPPGSRVVLIDDLIATGGTAISGFELVEAMGATVVEFAAIIGIPVLEGVPKIHARYPDVTVFTLVHDSAIPDSNCGDPVNWDKPRIITISAHPTE